MIPIDRVGPMLSDTGIDFLTGVPCSYLEPLMSYVDANDALPYVVAASEGEAIGIAAGAYLGGKLPMVLLQNSGLGNTVNPLTSLALTYRIPMLLLVSHRGEGGQDAPQHLVMGEITYPLLELMGIPAETLPQEAGAAEALLKRMRNLALERMQPVAVVVRKGSFEKHDHKRQAPPKIRVATSANPTAPSALEPDSRFKVLSALIESVREDDLVVSTTGMTSRELFTARDRPGNFYMVGSMGCAPALALGVSVSQPERRVVVIDGDGAFLMKMGTAATIGHYRPPGLFHVLLDNGTYETTGSQPTTAASVAFEGVAAAVNYARCVAEPDTAALLRSLAAFYVGDGPAFSYLRILDGHLENVPRMGVGPPELRDRFREAACGELHVP